MPNNYSNIFSGSAVIDVNNTSGFFPGQNNGVVAIYTLNIANGPQVQNIAYSRDGGYTFTDYPGNPVINSTSNQFRDPKVFWYVDRWVMVVSYAQEFTVGIFISSNLRNWAHASNFTPHGLLGEQYECPNLVQVPVNGTNDTMWLMFISIQPGAPLGGSISQYFPGTFDGTSFTAVDQVTRITDFAKDNYAGQFFYNTPAGQAVFIGWASNWAYTQATPTGPLEGWRSAMTLPRQVYLANITRTGWDLINSPYDLTPVMGPVLASNNSLGNGSLAVDFNPVSSNAVYLSVNVSNLPTGANASTISSAASLNFTFLSPVSGESLAGGYFFSGDTPFFLNRGPVRGLTDNVFFTDKFSTASVPNPQGTFGFEAVFDRSILEVFVAGGAQSATATFFPDQPLTVLSVRSAGLPSGVTVSVRVNALLSAWQQFEDAQGTVLGNVTSSSNSSTTTNSTTALRHRALNYKAEF